jgi:Asp-tRNA(Asn)/Glu-tRNA(Gln) amidotransferase A subunit family amidase
VERPSEEFSELMNGDVKGLRIGVPSDRWLWERETEEVESLVRSAIGVLEELGAAGV